MTVLMLLSEVRDHLAHDVQQIVLQVLQIEGIDVVGAFLNHNRAGGVMRSDADGTVLNAGLLYDFDDFSGYIVEGGDPAPGLQFQFFLIYFNFHTSTS